MGSPILSESAARRLQRIVAAWPAATVLLAALTACGSAEPSNGTGTAGEGGAATSASGTGGGMAADGGGARGGAGPVLPAMDRPLWLGYFKVAGRYGDYTIEATQNAGNTACVFASAGDFDLETQDPIALTEKAAADLDTLGAGIVIGGGAAEITAAAGYWSQVVTVYLSGEATGSGPLDPAPCEQQAVLARETIASLGLSNRPLLCYFDADISNDPGQVWHVPAGVDWIGLQAYLGPESPPTIEIAIEQLRQRIRGQMDRLPPGMPAIVIAQAYDRNGAWTDIPMLAAMQPIYLEEAALDDRIKGMFWFSYSRPGGTLTYERELRPWHEAIYAANVQGRPTIDVPP